MRKKTEYLIRFAALAAMAIVAPLWAIGKHVDSFGRTFGLVMEAVLIGGAAFNFWRYQRVSEEEKVHHGPPVEVVQRIASRRSRLIPLLALAAVSLLGGFELHSLRTGGTAHPLAILLLPAVGLLAAGGVFHPDILFGARGDIQGIGEGVRTVSLALMFTGIAIGLYGCYYFFWPR